MKESIISALYLVRHVFRLIFNFQIIFRPKNLKLKSENLYILANGPSFNQDLSENFEAIQKGDIIVVNGFANSDLFVQLKPTYYVLIDPLYWDNNIPNSDVDHERMVLFKILRETDWEMILYVPQRGYSRIRNVFKGNSKIKVVWFNDFVLNTKWDKINFSFYKLNLACPNLQNVLVASIFLAINLGYRKIFLAGTDHSWLKSIVLNENNDVCIKHDHFYEKEGELVPWISNNGSVYKMHEILFDLHNIFKGYYELNKYANASDVEIINFTKESYIDAFKKDI